MAGPKEIPQLVGEFTDMAKDYLRQETLDPAKRLKRVAAFGIAAGFVFFLGAIFLAVAGLRWIVEFMPGDIDHPYWSALGYAATAISLLVVAGLVAWRASK